MGRNPECLGRQCGYGLAPAGTVSSSNHNVPADVVSGLIRAGFSSAGKSTLKCEHGNRSPRRHDTARRGGGEGVSRPYHV